jgi:hypothetical protein
LQQIGTQIKTNIHLSLHQKVRSNSSEKESHHHDKNHQIIKRTTFLGNQSSNDKTIRRPSSSRLADYQTKTITQIVKQNPANPKNRI